jgi:hypothetical protein
VQKSLGAIQPKTISKRRIHWKKDPKTGKYHPTGKTKKIIEITGRFTTTPLHYLGIYSMSKITDLIERSVYIDKIEIFIPMDYIYEGIDWEAEGTFFRAFNPGSNPAFALHKRAHGLYVQILAEALDYDSDIYTQVIDYLRKVFHSCYVLPAIRKVYSADMTLLSEKTYDHPAGELSDEEVFKLWLAAVKVKTVEICFPLGLGRPRHFFRKEGFHDHKGTLYIDGRNSKDRKDHGKCYDMSLVNSELTESFTKFELNLFDTWVNLSLEMLLGTAEDILRRFEKEVKGELKKILLRNNAPVQNALFLRWYTCRNVFMYSQRKVQKKSVNRLELERFIAEVLVNNPIISVREMLWKVKERGLKGSKGTVHTRMIEAGWSKVSKR